MANSILLAKLSPIAAAHDRCRLRHSQTIGWMLASLAGVGLLALYYWADFFIPWQLPLLIVAAVGYSLFLGARARRHRTDPHDVARDIEQNHPELHALLLTALDTEPDTRTGDFNYLQKRVIREALEKNRRTPWGQRSDERLLFAQALHLVSICAFFLVAVALGSVQQYSAPQKFTDRVIVQPGNTTIERDSSVIVTATFEDEVPGSVELVLIPSDGPIRHVPLQRNLEDPVFGNSLSSVSSDTLYHVKYDGKQTEDYRLEVFDYPELVRSDATLDYPDYTDLPDRIIKDTRRVTALEGTQLTYSLLMNKTNVTGTLIGKDGSVVELTPHASQPSRWLAQISLLTNDTYQLEIKDSEGLSSKKPVDFVIRVKQNRPANLKLIHPSGDQRFSPVEEVDFEGEVWDDYGVGAYGFAYAVGAGEPTEIESGNGVAANEKHVFTHLLEIEQLELPPKTLVTYYLWADDTGPDGETRRNYSDLYFADIRPFEEIFREDQSGQQQQQQQQQQQGGDQGQELLELQKEIINAAWNIQKRESGRQPSDRFVEDADVVRQSQQSAISQLDQLSSMLTEERLRPMLQQARSAMEQTVEHLDGAISEPSLKPLPSAVGSARAAYHHLLQLMAEEFMVSQGQNAASSGSSAGNRSQQQLDQLELTQNENRYETQSQATTPPDEAQEEQLQILNRLKELARRQEDLNERLQELQTALEEARSEAEREAIEHQLKRLREDQRQMVEDMDELRQRMNEQNTPEAAEALSQLDEARSEAQQANEALEEGEISQSLASGSRTQQGLEELRDDYRRQTSNQFSEEMQDLRNRARELAERQDQIREDLAAVDENQRQSLGPSEEAERIAENASQQKEELESILEDVRSVSEESEDAEPLLSRQLHETYRNTDPADINQQLDYTTQLTRLNLVDRAQEFENQTHESIDELRERIDRAAESVLGDGVESLRRARAELDELLEDIQQEVAENLPEQNRGEPSPGDQEGDRENPQPGEGENQEPTQLASQSPTGDRPGQQPGEQPGGRSGEPNQDNPESGEGSETGTPGGTGGRNGEPNEPNDDNGQQSLVNAWNVGNNRGGPGGGGGSNGPLTGDDFREFSDRLREVEEMIDIEELQNDVATVRDRARAVRIEYQRNGKEPQWDLVQLDIEKPLVEIRKRVGEELARRLSRDAMVPIDRDPVPRQYSELVRRYYETLGEGAKEPSSDDENLDQ